MTNNQNTTAFFDLIRHGEPAGGPMFRGSKDDPLSDTGWQQMNAAIRDDDQWDVIITSPLLRCRLFAEQLAEQRQIPLHQEPRLREIAFGDWEGRTSENIMADTPEALTRFWSDVILRPVVRLSPSSGKGSAAPGRIGKPKRQASGYSWCAMAA